MISIKNKIENKFLDRLEVTALAQANVTRLKIKSELAKKLNVIPELIIIDKIHNKFGSTDVIVTAFAYNDKKTLNLISSKYKITRNTAKTVKEEEAPVQAPKAEEKSEEVKKEEE